MTSSTMRAVGFHKYGSAEVLEVLDVPRPTLSPDTVLIRVAAASVNPADWRIRDGMFKFFIRSPFPFILGADVAGVVEAVGESVTRFHPGDRVYAMIPVDKGGGYAEYAAVPEAAAAVMPAALPFVEAAAAPLTALTALQALRDKAKLQPGTRVLINGASGGVGTFAVQIAKAMGAHVTGVCSGRNAQLVRGLGADDVIDYTTTDVIAEKARYDVVFDAVNNFPFWKGLGVLRRCGVLVSVNPIAGNPVARALAQLRGRDVRSIFVQAIGADLEALNPWLESGEVRPVIDQTYPLYAAAEAHRSSETNRVRGKLVLIVDEALVGESSQETAQTANA